MQSKANYEKWLAQLKSEDVNTRHVDPGTLGEFAYISGYHTGVQDAFAKMLHILDKAEAKIETKEENKDG